MLKSLVLSGLLASGVGAFASAPFDNQPLYSPTTQAVIYNDETYEITLLPNELNNYIFDNFNNYMYETIQNEGTGAIFNGDGKYNTLNYTIVDEWAIDEVYFVKFEHNEDYIIFNLTADNDFILQIQSDEEDFSFSFTIKVFSTYYDDLKSAIELDIQANQPRSAGFISALVSFVTLLTSGIVALATGIASGVVGMAKALFLNSTATGLSIFGGIVAIFAGLALAVTLTTKVYQWITSLGS